MSIKLSDLVHNLSEINNKDCKNYMERKNIRSECEFVGLKNNRPNYRYKECNETSAKSVNDLIENFPRMYQFCYRDVCNFVLLLRKCVYTYEYIDSWEGFNETPLPPKKGFYSELNLDDISDKDYLHAQKVCDVLEIKNLGEYHDLYIHTDTSLLADVFEKFIDTCIEIYGLNPSHFFSAPGLVWQACFKKKCEFRIINRY